MLDHIGVPVADIETSVRFRPHFWLSSRGQSAADDLHVAFTAPDRDSVHAVFVRDPDGNNVEAVTHA